MSHARELVSVSVGIRVGKERVLASTSVGVSTAVTFSSWSPPPPPPACVHACVHACVRACMCVCVRLCVRLCVRTRARARAHARVRARTRACMPHRRRLRPVGTCLSSACCCCASSASSLFRQNTKYPTPHTHTTRTRIRAHTLNHRCVCLSSDECTAGMHARQACTHGR